MPHHLTPITLWYFDVQGGIDGLFHRRWHLDRLSASLDRDDQMTRRWRVTDVQSVDVTPTAAGLLAFVRDHALDVYP